MNSATDSTFDTMLSKLKDTNVVVALSGMPSCLKCQLSKKNIMEYKKENQNTKLSFIMINNVTDDVLESRYYQLNEMDEYPKVVIYNKDTVSFYEGEITLEKLKEFEKLA